MNHFNNGWIVLTYDVIRRCEIDYVGAGWYSFLVTLFNDKWGFMVDHPNDANFYIIVKRN